MKFRWGNKNDSSGAKKVHLPSYNEGYNSGRQGVAKCIMRVMEDIEAEVYDSNANADERRIVSVAFEDLRKVVRMLI